MAKILASSLLKTKFSGDIMVFRNTPQPLFQVPRVGLIEVYVKDDGHSVSNYHETAWCQKYLMSEFIDASAYDRIMFIDADCVALRNIDHLLEGEWDLAYQTEPGTVITTDQFSMFLTDEEMETQTRPGINSGHLAVRGSVYYEVMNKWREIDSGPALQRKGCMDQASWNRIILDSDSGKLPWKARHFERSEIMFPIYLDPQWWRYSKCALIHAIGQNPSSKIRFMTSAFLGAFYADDTATLINLLEI
jgi:hypothetical protein